MFRTALSFESFCLWIRYQPWQTRRFNFRQHVLKSTRFLGCFRTCSVKSFSKFFKITRILAFLFPSEIPEKVFQRNFLKLYSNRDIEIIEIFRFAVMHVYGWELLAAYPHPENFGDQCSIKNMNLINTYCHWKTELIG